MQKVWDELKKIEAQAEQIQADAQNHAKQIIAFAHQESDTLIAHSKLYGQEESQKLFAQAVEEANQNREELLKNNKKVVSKLKTHAKEHMDKVVLAVVKAILEENPP
ncbi:MAG: hypothetical protein LBI79_03020 [Nitrososphaerota archaeon]|jgi:vacuolar-type H+-ATPase subunit H|nr:hypothetical protein [Nitrososphaerota archaeon]